jgi:hypothetical protein
MIVTNKNRLTSSACPIANPGLRHEAISWDCRVPNSECGVLAMTTFLCRSLQIACGKEVLVKRRFRGCKAGKIKRKKKETEYRKEVCDDEVCFNGSFCGCSPFVRDFFVCHGTHGTSG